MDDDYLHPLADLLPVPHSSMVRHGQLPPLRYAVAASIRLSATGLNASADDPSVVLLATSSSRHLTAQDVWSEQEGKEQHVIIITVY